MIKILIIDDDEFLLDMYSVKFKEGGFLVEGAKGGSEALEKIQSFVPDFILVDMVMPNMDGFETIKALREKAGTNVKIIALSNLDQRENIDKAFSSGADDYIIKADFTPSQVLEKVKQILNL
ncbi:MAG TPA: response regulator [Candidatus Paceibacterota bacterium]